MKKGLLFLSLTIAAGAYTTLSAQICDGQRYFNKIFTTYTRDTATYTEPNANDASVTPQLLDIYTPQGDNATNRRAIVLIHGGSFTGGSRREAGITTMATEFCKRGYVVFSIDYRLAKGAASLTLLDSNRAYPVVIKSVSDGKAAVRYVKRHAAQYNVDSNWIVIAGESAGAIMGNHIAYVKTLDEAGPNLRSAFTVVGGLEGNSGNAGYTSRVKAVLNYAGSLLYTGLLTPDDTEPIYSAHGDADQTVPYLCGKVLGGASTVVTCGSGAMKPVLDGLSIKNRLRTYPGADHVPWESNAAELTQIIEESALFLYQIECPAFTSVAEVNTVNLNLYPNPATSMLTIKAESPMESILILDRLGREVARNVATSSEAHVNVSGIEAGIYIAKITMKDSQITMARSFIVE